VPLAAHGEFALSREHLETALAKKHVPRSDRITTPGSDQDLYAWLADIAVEQRDEAALGEYAPKAEAAASQVGHRLYLGVACRAWGVAHRLAGRPAEAEAQLGRALALFGELDARWQIGRTLFERGELAHWQGDVARAREDYGQALAAFEALRAEPMASRARAALARLA
jgi:hypothetical protein